VVANLLSEGQVVLSGAKSAIDRVPEVAKECGIRRAIPLSVAGAFHSPLMAPAAERLSAALEQTTMQAPAFPVFGNVTGQATSDVEEIAKNLRAQVVEPVLWVDAMKALVGSGVERIIEPGPGRVLAGIMRKIEGSCVVEGYNTLSDMEEK
jgi:[acyl-carrier-protein] S-malonyltransferase